MFKYKYLLINKALKMSVMGQLSLDEFAHEINLEKYVTKERCSDYLIYQLQQYLVNRKPELNPDKVLAAIQELEGGKPCGTKPATAFNGNHPIFNSSWQ